MARVVDIVKLQSDRAAPREDQSFPQEPIIKGNRKKCNYIINSFSNSILMRFFFLSYVITQRRNSFLIKFLNNFSVQVVGIHIKNGQTKERLHTHILFIA